MFFKGIPRFRGLCRKQSWKSRWMTGERSQRGCWCDQSYKDAHYKYTEWFWDPIDTESDTFCRDPNSDLQYLPLNHNFVSTAGLNRLDLCHVSWEFSVINHCLFQRWWLTSDNKGFTSSRTFNRSNDRWTKVVVGTNVWVIVTVKVLTVCCAPTADITSHWCR